MYVLHNSVPPMILKNMFAITLVPFTITTLTGCRDSLFRRFGYCVVGGICWISGLERERWRRETEGCGRSIKRIDGRGVGIFDFLMDDNHAQSRASSLQVLYHSERRK